MCILILGKYWKRRVSGLLGHVNSFLSEKVGEMRIDSQFDVFHYNHKWEHFLEMGYLPGPLASAKAWPVVGYKPNHFLEKHLFLFMLPIPKAETSRPTL